ncbi:MAG: AAA-like domain-containing protein [Clostridium sp.]|nr:AAA-like domain-containing protein [Clostridium sp.]
MVREGEIKVERYFNTEGICDPKLHYMVRLDDRIKEIRRFFVDRGKYFVINRGRQYGKTTTLRALAKDLRPDYLVLTMDFQEIGTAEYKDEDSFSRAFAEIFVKAFKSAEIINGQELINPIVVFGDKKESATLRELFDRISKLCGQSKKPVIVMIDEVDSAANNQVFIDFLALLRRYYMDRENQPIFHSVILAGVYDIKNLKLKLRSETEHQYNSPWNIAAEFDIEMSFTVEQIYGMLKEYEADRQTGADMETAAEEIYRYTSGYPYLVSAVCKLLDEKICGTKEFENGAATWTKEGVAEAVKLLLKKNTPLFDSMARQLDIYRDLRGMVEEILYQGKQISFSPMEKSVSLGVMFGFLKEEKGCVAVANRIFEMALLNMFMAEEAVKSEAFRYGQRDKNQFIKDGRLDMELVLNKFVVHFTDIYGGNDEKFIEEYGRKFFLLYLKPIINGTGNYYIEAQTRDARRTDVVVDYLGEQFVVELKIWHGNEYNERGEEQLAGYLDYFHVKKGYMLSFNFNKKKEMGVKTVRLGDRAIVEAVV